jgi:hypothetical protein
MTVVRYCTAETAGCVRLDQRICVIDRTQPKISVTLCTLCTVLVHPITLHYPVGFVEHQS